MTEAENITEKSNCFYGTGRRKRAVARVWLTDGAKENSVNNETLEAFFPRETLRMIINQPFEATQLSGRFGIRATVDGGGLSGQAFAVRLGIARALLKFDAALRSVLRKNGFLTRDPREKERKKYGHKGARRSFQYTKR